MPNSSSVSSFPGLLYLDYHLPCLKLLRPLQGIFQLIQPCSFQLSTLLSPISLNCWLCHGLLSTLLGLTPSSLYLFLKPCILLIVLVLVFSLPLLSDVFYGPKLHVSSIVVRPGPHLDLDVSELIFPSWTFGLSLPTCLSALLVLVSFETFHYSDLSSLFIFLFLLPNLFVTLLLSLNLFGLPVTFLRTSSQFSTYSLVLTLVSISSYCLVYALVTVLPWSHFFLTGFLEMTPVSH